MMTGRELPLYPGRWKRSERMTYDEMCSFEVLYQAYLNARKRKRKKPGTAQYEANALACTNKLSHILANDFYHPSKFEVFYVYEPKKRLIQAPAFVDKVVLHAVVDNILYDAICKSFIRDNHASQKGKGTHDGLYRLKWHMIDYYRKNGTADGWVLKCDVRKFFASIDHEKMKPELKALLEKRGVDPRIYDLLCVYIDASEGLPLGYQTSQLLALMYLDEFDHMMKEKYWLRYYDRFMDDFCMIHPDKKFLQNLLKEITAYMKSKGLELNEKTGIFPLRNGIDVLGFHSYLDDNGGVVQKLGKLGLERFKRAIRYWQVAYPAGEVTRDEIIVSFTGMDAHAAFGDTYSLRKKFAAQVGEIIGGKVPIHRKINSTRIVRAKRQIREAQRLFKSKHKADGELHSAKSSHEIPPWEEVCPEITDW